MSSPFLSSSLAVALTSSHSQQPFVYLDNAVPREVLEAGTLANGWSYQVLDLSVEDSPAIFAFYETEYNNEANKGKEFLLRRNEAEIRAIFEKNNGDILAVATPEGLLLAVGAVSPVADEADMGRGAAYQEEGCTIETQTYFKGAAVHPIFQNSSDKGKPLNLMNILYPHRLVKALQEEGRTCFLTKTNNPKVQKAFTRKGWKAVAEATEITEAPLVTFKLTATEAEGWLAENCPDIHAEFLLNKVEVSGNMAHVSTSEKLQHKAA